jgi:hypothetical protein
MKVKRKLIRGLMWKILKKAYTQYSAIVTKCWEF